MRTLEESFGTTYHAVALDIDGTVTESGSGDLTPEIISIINRILGKGIYVIFVTGGGRTTIKRLFNQLDNSLSEENSINKKLYAISGNGCLLIELDTNGEYLEKAIAIPLNTILEKSEYNKLKKDIERQFGKNFKVEEKKCGIRMVAKNTVAKEEENIDSWFRANWNHLGELGVKVLSGRYGSTQTYDISMADKDYAMCWFHTEFDFIDVPILRIGDQGKEGANDYSFLDSQYGFSVGSLSKAPTRCLPVYSYEQKRILRGVEGTSDLLNQLQWSKTLTIPSFLVPETVTHYQKISEELLENARNTYDRLGISWSKEASKVLQENCVKRCVDSKFKSVFDHKSGAIRFSDIELKEIDDSSSLKQFFLEEDPNIRSEDHPGLLRCMYTDSGIIMRGPRYYLGLSQKANILQARILVEENKKISQLIQKEIDEWGKDLRLADWKLKLAVLDHFRNNCLLLYSMLFQAACLNTASQPYWKRLLRSFEPFVSAAVGLYYSMLMTDSDKYRLSMIDLHRSMSGFYDLQNVIGSLYKFLDGNKIDPTKIIRRWREVDHPGHIYAAIWSVSKDIEKIFQKGNRTCALGIMHGGLCRNPQ